MQFRKLLCAVLFLFVLVTVAQADPITLNVTSWGFGTSTSDDQTRWLIRAVDLTGKTVTIQFRYNNTLLSAKSFSTEVAVSGLPYTATTDFITANFGISNQAKNGIANYTIQGDFPSGGTPGVLTVPLGFSGSIVSGSQVLSFAFTSGEGRIGYSPIGGVMSVGISGTGGTVTIDTVTAPIPEPATLLLLGSGLAAMGLKARRRKR